MMLAKIQNIPILLVIVLAILVVFPQVIVLAILVVVPFIAY